MDVPNCGTEDYAAAKRQLEVAAKLGPISEGAHAVAMAQVHAIQALTTVMVAGAINDLTDPARAVWADMLGLELDDNAAGPDGALILQSDDFATQVRYVIRRKLPNGVAEAVIGSDAFGALVYRLREYCNESPTNTLITAFRALDGDLQFCGDADDPAAFLAAKVRDLL
jgi:hypothetical protein